MGTVRIMATELSYYREIKDKEGAKNSVMQSGVEMPLPRTVWSK